MDIGEVWEAHLLCLIFLKKKITFAKRGKMREKHPIWTVKGKIILSFKKYENLTS